jgi:UDP-4-amino-4,6-dideoxy-N-acetyl-beta-L-altrosamine N-acetyltransferase
VKEARLRPMTAHDLDRVRAWRNRPEIRRVMFTAHEIAADEHRRWFEMASVDPTRRLLIFELDGEAQGYVQFSGVAPGAAFDWGFYTAPDAVRGTGRRMGTAALDYAFGEAGASKVLGQALLSNDASIGFHLALGFTDEGERATPHVVGGETFAVRCFGMSRDQWLALRRTE